MRQISDLLMFLFLLICSFRDIRTKTIPTVLLVGASCVTVIFCLSRQNIGSAVIGIAVGVFFCCISRYTDEAIGYGDSWLLMILGGYLGGMKILELSVLAFLFAGSFSLAGVVWRKWKRTERIPFVPFMAAAYVGVMMI